MASPSALAGGAADWEARWQTSDTPWDRGTPAPPLLDWLSRNTLSGRVLVPGCGSGHDVRALAAAGAEPIGIDISPSAIAHAGMQSPAGAERYRVENLFALPPELVGMFDWVFEHTCFCAIDPALRANYVSAVRAALKSGGQLLAIFYLDPGKDVGPPFGVSREELDSLFGGAFETLEEYVPTVAHSGREGRELVRVMRRR